MINHPFKLYSMENKKNALLNHSIVYGLVTGGLLVLLSLIINLSNLGPKNPIVYLSYLILIAGIIWGSKEYRDKIMGGFISYGNSLLVGFLIGMFAALISAVFTFIYIKFIDPAIVEKWLEIAETSMLEKNPNMSQDQIDTAMNMTQKFMKPGWMLITGFIGQTFISFILSLIVSIFIKKEDQMFGNTNQ